MASYNYPLAFIEYCKGTPLEDVATILEIPEGLLRQYASSQNWARLKNELPVVAADGGGTTTALDSANKTNAKVELMLRNREKNLEGWETLRQDAFRLAQDLVAGKLRFKRYFHNKGQIIEHVCEPTMSDRTALANYFMLICNGTYSAHGDRGATTGAKDEATATAQASQAPAIQIVLPGAITMPRAERQDPVPQRVARGTDNATVVDVQEVGSEANGLPDVHPGPVGLPK